MDKEAKNAILKLKENERRLLDDKNRDARRRQKDAKKMQSDAERIRQLECEVENLRKDKKETSEGKEVEELPEASGGLNKAQKKAVEFFKKCTTRR